MQHGLLAPSGETDHTLVVVFLRGGADGLSMVVPVEDDAYYRQRGHIGIDRGGTERLDDVFGLHSAMAPLMPVYHDGALAIIHQAGSEDQTRSHFEAQDFMEHGGHAVGGWLARYLRAALDQAGPLSAVALAKTQPEVLRGAPASVVLESFDTFDFGASAPGFFDALATLYDASRDALGAAGRDMLQAMRRLETLREADYRPEHGAVYGENGFARGLRQAAQLIRADVGVRAVSLDLSGWDSHFAQGPLITPLMARLAGGLDAFRRDLGPGMDHVTVVVMSEFGRRVYENASFGTDHGRGGVMFVLGGGVEGGRVIHEWPGLAPEHLEGPGDLPVVFNYRDVLAPILRRHGGLDDLAPVFPGTVLAPVNLYGNDGTRERQLEGDGRAA